jgi:opacity protein-like surface antigen
MSAGVTVDRIAIALTIGLLWTSGAAAGQRWDVEVHAGALVSTNPERGTAALPPSNPPAPGPFQPASSAPPVASWYFGDGARFLTQLLPGRLGLGIVALDPVVQSRFVERRSGGAAGVRIGRALSSRLGVELSIDRAAGQLSILKASSETIKASQASFLTTWNALLSPRPIALEQLGSDATLDDRRGSQLLTTAALLVNVASTSAVKPYVALGAGYIVAQGHEPSATLVGAYRFTFVPPITTVPTFPIEQTDTVTIRSSAKNTMTWLVGGGVKYAVSDHWGVRGDFRDHINRDVVRTSVSTSPTSAPLPAGAGALLTLGFADSPAIVFSNTTAVRSTLSATVIDFRTFTGRGVVNQLDATAGVFFRF